MAGFFISAAHYEKTIREKVRGMTSVKEEVRGSADQSYVSFARKVEYVHERGEKILLIC